ncbi:MAG: lactate utilization protein B [Congregibacter sp.]
MDQQASKFLEAAAAAIQDTEHAVYREALGKSLPDLRDKAVKEFGGAPRFAALRQHVKKIRQHSLRYLGHYLERFVQQARENGNHVHFASNGDELNSIVLDICLRREATRVAKGKSMITEETGLNAILENAGIAVRETDLGEYIIQTAGETPSHIIGPALHKTEAEIRELFLEQHQLGDRGLDNVEELVAEARQMLRDDFLEADIGIIGSNALIAENGYSMLVTNEGNGDLCANLPQTLIICTSVDRVLPRTRDAMAMLRLLARSTTGQAVSCYTSFYSGPKSAADLDGPQETHIVLLDNGRSEVLASDYQEMLQCIRCGACLNHCPVYMSAGGHAYGSVYPGPMGSVLTPLLGSLEDSALLPNACTACGRCEEVCPAAIPLPDLLRDLRAEQFSQRITAPRWRLGLRMHAWLVLRPRLYRWTTGIAVRLMHFLGGREGVLRRLPFASGWLEARDLPAPASRSFMQWHERHHRP